MNKGHNTALLIPSFNPDDQLIKLINELIELGINNIFVVNDGSTDNYTFKYLDHTITLLSHKENLGKGEAIKTGINHILKTSRDIKWLITCDDDFQHSPEDIFKLFQLSANACPNSFFLGYRSFDKLTPFKSRIGNKIMSLLIRLIYRRDLKDTQSGLRMFHRNTFEKLSNVPGRRFSYEISVLKEVLKSKELKLNEIPIKTIYFNNNSKTKFNPIYDSIDVVLRCIK